MRIGTIEHEGGPAVALAVGEHVVPVRAAASALGDTALEQAPDDLAGIIAEGPARWQQLETFAATLEHAEARPWWRRMDEVRFLAPLRPPRNPWAVAGNSLAHMRAAKARLADIDDDPGRIPFFTKAITSITGDRSAVVYDKRATVAVDYECELTIVIGRAGRDIAPAAALDHVFGYTVGNDITARDLQIAHGQYFRGKSLDGFGPLGPLIATTAAIPDPRLLRLRQWVNGELRQDGLFGEMTWQVPEIVSELSAGMTLEPGDVILTGTCPEVGFEKMPQIWLQDGDEVVAEIEGIGPLRNTIRMARRPADAAL